MKYKAMEDIKQGNVIVLNSKKRQAKLLRTTEDYTSIIPFGYCMNSHEDYAKNAVIDMEIETKISDETKEKIEKLKAFLGTSKTS